MRWAQAAIGIESHVWPVLDRAAYMYAQEGFTKQESRRPNKPTGDSRGKSNMQSPLWTANHNGRDTNKSAGAPRGQPAQHTHESQLQGRKQESRRPKGATGDSSDAHKRAGAPSGQPATAAASLKGATSDRGKTRATGRAPHGSQIAMAGTQTREPAPQGVNSKRPESRRPKRATGDSRGKSNSRAFYGPQIAMAGTQTREPAPQGGNRVPFSVGLLVDFG